MIVTLLISLFCIFLDLLATLGTAKSDKDVEIIILRQQVRILQRKTKTPIRISDPEKMVLATLVQKYGHFKQSPRRHLDQVMLIFKPDTSPALAVRNGSAKVDLQTKRKTRQV